MLWQSTTSYSTLGFAPRKPEGAVCITLYLWHRCYNRPIVRSPVLLVPVPVHRGGLEWARGNTVKKVMPQSRQRTLTTWNHRISFSGESSPLYSILGIWLPHNLELLTGNARVCQCHPPQKGQIPSKASQDWPAGREHVHFSTSPKIS